MMRFTLVAVSNPVEGRADACADWYDGTHLHDMLNVPGIISARRFELLRGAPSKAFKRYLALYEVEAASEEDARSIIDRLNATNLPLNSSLDVASVNLGVYRATGPRLEAQAAFAESNPK